MVLKRISCYLNVYLNVLCNCVSSEMFSGNSFQQCYVRKQISRQLFNSCFDLVILRKWVLQSDAHNLCCTITEKMLLKMRIYEQLRKEIILKQKA